MIPDISDTIAAIGTAPGGAARGMIRVSGPNTILCLSRCFRPSSDAIELAAADFAQVIPRELSLGPEVRPLPCDLFLWPDEQSYTRQPSAELHTIGSPPLLEQALTTLCQNGARLAEPGEFTLRAFLAGRLDLTQAEAVLGVIDATHSLSLQTALGQLAGGLSKPLGELREQLLQLLAHLEAGLDFVEEDINFISSEEIEQQLSAALELVVAILDQLASRSQSQVSPRMVLVGRPNAGKSSLFNALVQRFPAREKQAPALVSHHAGTTRDYLAAQVNFHGLVCELIDTAGATPFLNDDTIAGLAQGFTADQRRQADGIIMCVDATDSAGATEIADFAKREFEGCHLLAMTKVDLLPGESNFPTHPQVIPCSSRAGTGLHELSMAVYESLRQRNPAANSVASTAARCGESLHCAQKSLQNAIELVVHHGGEELIAAEIRNALQELGRVVGAVYTDDVLDRVFSQFCIGK